MALLPTSQNDYNTYSFYIDKTRSNTANKDSKNIVNIVDEKEVLQQSVFKILNTQRNKYLEYKRDYNIELLDLFGEQLNYVITKFEGKIKEALITDDRIIDAHSFQFEKQGNKLMVNFNISTIYGEISDTFITNI